MGTEKAIQHGEIRQRKKNNWKPGENMGKGSRKNEECFYRFFFVSIECLENRIHICMPVVALQRN